MTTPTNGRGDDIWLVVALHGPTAATEAKRRWPFDALPHPGDMVETGCWDEPVPVRDITFDLDVLDVRIRLQPIRVEDDGDIIWHTGQGWVLGEISRGVAEGAAAYLRRRIRGDPPDS